MSGTEQRQSSLRSTQGHCEFGDAGSFEFDAGPVKFFWTSTEFDAPGAVLWELLVDPAMWPLWGPSVRSAVIEADELELGAHGRVTTVFGVTLPFEITRFEPGTRWSWNVCGVLATDHRVQSLGPRRCRVDFGVPWPAMPYLLICRVALGHLRRLSDDRHPRT